MYSASQALLAMMEERCNRRRRGVIVLGVVQAGKEGGN
ncbi:hypothetical protein Pyrfu_0694 [Pyrolobus fumarii 1A]|uniref:Uncharacterized protein n=1 Tax=Pyrolobus fumarii (strain DSM 11204 / 1A) TaxID=694429 RepID=G0ED04_PYRF1|nr:hypothetical protein Pyrfu_0694 [Pyrolobus fumarii 1A]